MSEYMKRNKKSSI